MIGGTKWDSLNSSIISCQLCPRLVEWREMIAQKRKRAYQDEVYWGKPIPGFGDFEARLLVVGLAPGAHGSNRTGRMFTGDASGDFLYPALHRAGFANQPLSKNNQDGLMLKDIYITSSCRCVPPGNKPTLVEIQTCRPFLLAEIELLPNIQGIVALGRVAFENILAIYKNHPSGSNFWLRHTKHPTITSIIGSDRCLQDAQINPFSHGALYYLDDAFPWLLASYHPSRQNTQTGRLTQVMFDQVWRTARNHLI